MADPFLSVRDLTVRFDKLAEPVIDRVSFEVARGETVALVGASGEGKTTIARALIGLLPPSASVTGSILLEGRELIGKTERQWVPLRGSTIAMIVQEPELALNPVLRIRRQVDEVLRSHVRVRRRERMRRVSEALTAVGLIDPQLHSAYPNQISGGQRQRVVIAQALVANPALLIADEPTSALDTVAQSEVIGLLKYLKSLRQLSLIFITHNRELLAGFADRILTLRAGRLAGNQPTAGGTSTLSAQA